MENRVPGNIWQRNAGSASQRTSVGKGCKSQQLDGASLPSNRNNNNKNNIFVKV